MIYVNQHIKDLYRTSDAYSRRGYLRLDMNENPKGLPKEFVESVVKEITPEFLSTYPEKMPMLRLLGKLFNKKEECFELFNGSDEGIRLIFETFVPDGGKVVASEPTFAMYQVYAKMRGLEYQSIRYDKDFCFPVDAFIDAIDEKTNLVFVVNPNNPIGTAFSNEEMTRIVEKAKACDALVVVDEAYHYFYKSSFVDYLDRYDNIIVLRTFSKLFSLAACRLGIAISNPENIRALRNACCSYNVNSIALKFGEKILEKPEIIDTLVKIHNEGKEYLVEQLKANGYKVVSLEGNFIFVKPNMDAQDLALKLREEKKILVKTYGGDLLNQYLRISTGDKESMDKFLNALLALDK